MVSEKMNNNEFKVALAGVAGNILEWYDFAIFGYFSDIIGVNFFPPNQEGNASLIEAFTVFGLAFLARPIGGAFIGKMGDIYGRKRALETSLFFMAFPTLALGCLPTYAMAGWLSTALLILVRLIQGLSVGGQLTSALVFTLERTHISKWGFWASTVYAASSIGVSLSSLIASILRDTLSDEQLQNWGWRIPFWLGGLGALPAMYLRYNVPEYSLQHIEIESDNDEIDNADEQSQNSFVRLLEQEMGMELEVDPNSKQPIRDSFAKPNRRALIAVAFATTVPATAYYIIFVWFAIFMESLGKTAIPHAFAINSINTILGSIFFLLLAGWFTDQVKRYVTIMVVSGILLGSVFPLALDYIGSGLSNNAGIIALFIQLFLSILLVIWVGAMLPWMVFIFPPEIRLTSLSLGYNVSVGIWGGFSPLIATILTDQISFAAPGYFVAAAVALGLIGLWIAPSINYEELFDQKSELETLDIDESIRQPLLSETHADI